MMAAQFSQKNAGNRAGIGGSSFDRQQFRSPG
jgi:hypothetical protein